MIKKRKAKAKVRYFKFLDARAWGGSMEFYGPFSMFNYEKWMPKGGKPGPWLPLIKRPRLCNRGYHACRANQLQSWAVFGYWLYEVELSGKMVEGGDKVATSRMRILRRIKTVRRLRAAYIKAEIETRERKVKLYPWDVLIKKEASRQRVERSANRYLRLVQKSMSAE